MKPVDSVVELEAGYKLRTALKNAPISRADAIEPDKLVADFISMYPNHANEMQRILGRIGEGLRYAIDSRKLEPSDKKVDVDTKFWNELKDYARSLGVGLIGFAPTKEEYIFQGYRLHYDHGIVLGMEMDFESIEEAPSGRAGFESMRVYAELGIATNKIADYLREKGYRAQACHPLGGQIIYPAMGVSANLGEIGQHGLLISPEFGPRQRLSLIATEAAPLPRIKRKGFGIEEYCKKCAACMKACPGNAILSEPIANQNGTTTRIDYSKCLQQFYSYTGCSLCIKVCPFNRIGYKKITALKK